MQDIRRLISEELNRFVHSASENVISAEIARTPEVTGLVLYDEPIFCVADAKDPLFEELKNPDIVGKHILLPNEWLPDAKSVISFILPYTERVRASNRVDYSWPSVEWLHGRIQGLEMAAATSRALVEFLKLQGFNAISPILDPRIGPRFHFEREIAENTPPRYNSRWPERHAAYIAGLGTFSLCKGLITEVGMAGRLGSVITDAPITPDTRPYTDIFEYCIWCGACMRNCPADAITMENGKDNHACSGFIDKVIDAEGGIYYGCGKCQVGVPCEKGIPAKP